MQKRAMRRIGHRGAMGHAAENTITSFKKALDLLCDEVETDVWLTQDGRMLVSHDRPTAKTTLSLDEVLDFCRGRMAVNVELKCEKDETRARDTGASVAKRLAARGSSDTYVSSFWWWALHPNRAYVTPDLVRAAHAASLKVNAWTVNEPKEITTFRNWSVDGIMSDYPERVPKD